MPDTKVKVNRYGITHAHAMCATCDWTDGLYMDKGASVGMQNLRSRVRTHVKTTGHMVMLETAKSTHYNPITES